VTRSRAAAIIAIIAIVVVSSAALAGCWNGPSSTTMMQATMNSGNGVQATVGNIKVENATLVAGPEGTTTGTLTLRIVNTGQTPDSLVYTVIENGPAYVTPGSETFAPNASVSFGFDSKDWINTYTLKAAAGTYVPVELGFKEAGLVKISVLIVPPTGYYEGIAPNPATMPSATATPAAS